MRTSAGLAKTSEEKTGLAFGLSLFLIEKGKGRSSIKINVFKGQKLRNVVHALPRKYGVQMKPTDELVSVIFYTKDEQVITSGQAKKGMDKILDSSHRKIAIAYNFSEEAIVLLKEQDVHLITASNFPWTDEQWKNRGTGA